MTPAGTRIGIALAVSWAALPVMPLTGPAMAQVSVNPGALDSLGSTNRPAASKPSPRAPAKPPPRRPASTPQRDAGTRPVATGRTGAAPPAAPPVVAPAPPPVAVVAPPVTVPTPAPAPVPPVPVVEAAIGDATKVVGGVRVTFGPGSSDVNATTAAALRTLARTLRDNEKATVNVAAYAASVADDPSTPRRISLARALAVRSILINEGFVSTRIYVRALGANAVDGPADRVDVVQVGMAPQAGIVVAGTPRPAAPAPAPPQPSPPVVGGVAR